MGAASWASTSAGIRYAGGLVKLPLYGLRIRDCPIKKDFMPLDMA